jgi:protein-S-isoprenylcysteine O-methyltransferase Ste14
MTLGDVLRRRLGRVCRGFPHRFAPLNSGGTNNYDVHACNASRVLARVLTSVCAFVCVFVCATHNWGAFVSAVLAFMVSLVYLADAILKEAGSDVMITPVKGMAQEFPFSMTRNPMYCS